MFALLTTVFVTSLTGSLHCAGMCGPFALMAGLCGDGKCDSGKSPASARRINWIAMANYHLGRLVTYALTGFLAGSMGAAVNLGAGLAGFQRAATWGAGIAMVVVGVMALARQWGWMGGAVAHGSWLTRMLQPLMRRVVRQSAAWRGLGIGVLTCLMPCGWLYVFAITAAGTANPLWGALTMVVFWSGTVPVLAVMVVGAGSFVPRVNLNLPVVTACLVIGLGLYTMMFRAPVVLAGSMPVAVSTSAEEAAGNLKQVDHGRLPCCCSATTANGE